MHSQAGFDPPKQRWLYLQATMAGCTDSIFTNNGRRDEGLSITLGTKFNAMIGEKIEELSYMLKISVHMQACIKPWLVKIYTT